jgi:hypothetical protein
MISIMDTSDGSDFPAATVNAARIRLASAEASVTSAKRDAKIARNKRKEAKEVERRARKRLRRAKRELREAKCLLATAEESQPRPARPRRLKPIEAVKTQTATPPPRPTVRATKKPRKRAVRALKPIRSRRSSTAPPPVETNSEPLVHPLVVELPAVTPPESTPPAPSI